MWKRKSLPQFTAWYILAIFFSSSASSFQYPRVVSAREKDLYDPQISEENLYSTSNLSTTKKIELLRYYLSPRIPGESIALVVDTSEPFYDIIKRLWKAVFTNEDEIQANILLFTYNDTDCSLVPQVKNHDTTLREALAHIPATKSISNNAEMIFECLNFALNMTRPESSVTLFTGRKAGDGLILGERTALGMIEKRCKLNGIWCNDDEENGYEEMVYKTNGIFLRFSGQDDQYGRIEKSEKFNEEGSSLPLNLQTRSENNWNSRMVMSEEKLEGKNSLYDKTNREDESADLILYDPKISGKSERDDFAMILNPDSVIERKEAFEVEDMKLASLTAIESALRMEDTSVEITAETSLVGRPGSVARLTYRVTNNYPLTIRHYFQAKSTSFNIVYLQPRNAWIEAGQTMNVVADVLVPTTATDAMIETVTLTVQGIGSVEKSAYIYVRQTGSTISDTTKPTITYSFNNNCAEKLGSSVCAKSLWSVDVTIRDSDSGLQRVASSPKGIRATSTTFISGIKSSTSFQYAASCCQTSVVITAEDLLGNSNSLTIDVNEWYNLSWGQIAAIVLGVLLLIVLLIVIIIAVLFFIQRRKKSQDLSFSQRYGTRPQRAERTSF